jgi:hypothetical protein
MLEALNQCLDEPPKKRDAHFVAAAFTARFLPVLAALSIVAQPAVAQQKSLNLTGAAYSF